MSDHEVDAAISGAMASLAAPYEARIKELESRLHQSDLNFDALEKQNVEIQERLTVRIVEIQKLQGRLSSCENDLKTEREAVALSGRMHRVASDERNSYASRLDVLTKQLAAVCSVEHSWRSSDFHEKSSPHWICRHCGKQEPKDIDHWHDRERVVEKHSQVTAEDVCDTMLDRRDMPLPE